VTFACANSLPTRALPILARLQPPSYIVNTARGDIIDEDALVKLIQTGKIAGAGLDVYENEPVMNTKLLKLATQGKMVLLPHMSSDRKSTRLNSSHVKI